MAMVTLFKDGGAAPDPGARVIKADAYAAVVDVADVLAAARDQADELLRRADVDAGDIRERARREGLEEGKAEVAEQLFEAVTASVEQISSMENAMVDVVMRSLRTILGSFDDKDLATRVVGQALRLVRDEKRVVLRVALEDADTVRERLAEIVAAYPGMGRVDVHPDSALKPGGCVLETDAGVIDATLERQLTIIRDTFKRHLEERGR